MKKPLYVARLIMESRLNIEKYIAIYIAYLIPANLFRFATLFLVIVLCAEKFIAIHYYLRYQELVTQTSCCCCRLNLGIKRTVFVDKAVDPKSIMYVVFGITQLVCIIASTFFSIRIYLSVRLHVNEMRVLQLQQAPQNAQMVNVRRMRKLAMMSVYVLSLIHI